MARYALLIGISEYSDPKVGTLKKSIRDVEALERVLADPERGNFSVTKLINCTKRESDLAVSALTKKRVHGETILLYFSGHGIRDDDCNLQDRKSTRLNSSHLGISYAVFCLK